MKSMKDLARLLKEAAASMKGDVKGAIKKLEAGYEEALQSGADGDGATLAEELARAWTRRKSRSRPLYYARKGTRLSPERKTAWTTLAKACELVASGIDGDTKRRRAQTLYSAAAEAFKKAASLTRDPEDKRWLLELAKDAAREAKSKEQG
jgi:hypothetical protein